MSIASSTPSASEMRRSIGNAGLCSPLSSLATAGWVIFKVLGEHLLVGRKIRQLHRWLLCRAGLYQSCNSDRRSPMTLLECGKGSIGPSDASLSTALSIAWLGPFTKRVG